jgi:epoxyqueuosine reductase QueG
MVNDLICKLHNQGADIIKVVDISMLSDDEKRGYDRAVLIGIGLNCSYIRLLITGDDIDEFTETEERTDHLAEWAAEYIIAKGYRAFAQSENNLIKQGNYNASTKSTLLPHKKVALLAGLGWIGKNNLLVTKEYGSAVSMCTVLTDMPLPTENATIIMPKCGNCMVCKNVCYPKAIHGTTWGFDVARDDIVDVYHCETCLKCLAHCPWTLNYMKNGTS